MNDFRPISLLNAMYKVLTKVFANRLNPEQVEKVQATNIKVRFILAEVAILQEIICGHFKKRLKGGVLFK